VSERAIHLISIRRTLLAVTPAGVAMPPLPTGFGNRDHLERNGKIESSRVGPSFCEVAQKRTLQDDRRFMLSP
jgi:hypothetical protein